MYSSGGYIYGGGGIGGYSSSGPAHIGPGGGCSPGYVEVPVRRPAAPSMMCSWIKTYGAILALLAAASLSLGIANVVLTREAYCNPWNEDSSVWCSNSKEPYIWTWVASGIWASVPVFFAGLFAMCVSSNPLGWSRWFALFIFLSAIVFAPGMVVLSSIETWRGSASDYNFYKLNNGVNEGNIIPDGDNPYQAKFALPLVIAILGGLEFLMAAYVTLSFCWCSDSLGIDFPTEVAAPVAPATRPPVVYYSPRPQISSQVEVYRPSPPAPRYNPVGVGVGYGAFPSRANFGGYFSANAGGGVYGGGSSNPYRWY